MSLTRRASLLLPAVLLAVPSWEHPVRAAGFSGVPAGNRLAFTAWRNGSRIGTHTASFHQSAGVLAVDTMAHFSVGLGPISLYAYTYEVHERWVDGVLDHMDARTNDDGAAHHCTIQRRDGRLMVDGSVSGRYTAPAGSIAGTHWNKAELQAPIINPENGVLMTYTVTSKGSDPPPGSKTDAAHFALTGFATLDLWYDAANIWVGLRGVAKDKSVVEYHAA